MGRRIRRVALGAVAVVAILVGSHVWVRIAGRSVVADAISEAERRVRDTGPRPRAAMLEPAEAGDASAIYQELFSKEPLRDTSEVRTYDMWFWPSNWRWDDERKFETPAWADDVVARVLALSHRPLVDPLSGLVAELDPDRGSPASYAAFILTLCATKKETPPAQALRFAAAALVIIDDWQLFGSGDTWVTPDATLAALDAIGAAVANGARDAVALESVARILDSIASRPAPSRPMATWLALDAALEAGLPPPGRMHWGSCGSSDPSAQSAGWRWLWSPDAANAESVRVARAQAAHVLSNWDTPPERLPAAIWGPQVCGGPPLGSSQCFPITPRFLAVRLEGHEKLALARAAVALARWAAAHGSFPPTLESLVPAYASSVPMDPMTGRPLRYDGARIWSAGPNLRDDLGVPIARGSRHGDWDGDRLVAPDGDEVWSLTAGTANR